MKPFSLFTIEPVTFDEISYLATYRYTFDDTIVFEETIDFSGCGKAERILDRSYLTTLLFHSSLAIGISYYKLYPTQYIEVRSGKLDASQITFWQTFYLQGLGEFFYTNQLDPTGLANIRCVSEERHQLSTQSVSDRYLVPIGGGKDSCVTIELLQQQGKDIILYTHGRDYPIHQDIATIAGLPRIVTPRTMDPLLFSMNNEGYYNGHVPVTGIISFVSLIVAYFSDCGYIAFSNERSANFGNTTWQGLEINHQRSKSYAFEKDFQDYIHHYIHPQLTYQSILRPWYEARIAQLFSTYTAYFPVFTSCNRNFHLQQKSASKRCCSCPKCAFTYAMLRPFLTQEQTQLIRQKELYADAHLLELFQTLWGTHGIKPFECVGTYEEIQYATRLYLQQHEQKKQYPVLERFNTHITPTKTVDERKMLGTSLLAEYSVDEMD